ncbi:MAG TPA: Rieske 2Fe-2S domain-containing protein, partial [Gemmatimonadaceae bacterium]|nr:Rieske 2Fe-2S domain-containing protein [Gemmatimonadaceae bacterium]
MTDPGTALTGPDFGRGIPISEIADNAMVMGHVNGEAVVLARRGSELFAFDAFCTHYGAPLSDGLLVDDTVRCPWHHACFSLRTGEAVRAPALDDVSCWRVEQRDGKAYVGEKLEVPTPPRSSTSCSVPHSVLIIGGGAAGNAAAEMLRREGYAGGITMLSADQSGPCDRPNLSKG